MSGDVIRAARLEIVARAAASRPAVTRAASALLLTLLCCPVAHGQTSSSDGTAAPTPALRTTEAPWPIRQRAGLIVFDEERDLGPRPPRAITVRMLRRLGRWPRTTIGTRADAWPLEPPSPTVVSSSRFSQALAALCSRRPPSLPANALARSTLQAAERFAVDPFLLAALAVHESGCDPALDDSDGIGLTRIHPGMWREPMLAHAVRDALPAPTADEHQTKSGLRGRSPPFAQELRDPAFNLHFAAAALSLVARQCPAIDTTFGSVPHRSPVSHFIFGDRVPRTLPEDQVLVVRRRLLQHYAPIQRPAAARYRELELLSPLQAPPRLVIGVMGDPRAAGKRLHAGIDLDALDGEPVFAMAAGRVVFAGADLDGERFVELGPEPARALDPSRMGPRGLFVTIAHEGGITTLYAHLASYAVRTGDHVSAGSILGWVGRSGMRVSNAHLHLGIFQAEHAIDPAPLLAPYTVPLVPHAPQPARPRRASRLSTPSGTQKSEE